MVISFIGHRSLHDCKELSESIKRTITENIDGQEKVLFFCGGYGGFDDLCARVCHIIKKERGNCEVVFVTPYMTEGQQEKTKQWMQLGIYDSVIYPPLEKVPLKFAINKRNEWMIDQSDFIIAYVKHSFGGAYQSLSYAHRKKKRVINLNDAIEINLEIEE